MVNGTRTIRNYRFTDRDLERYWSKVERTDGHCWRWTDARNNTGYGVFAFNQTTTSAHRIAYQLLIGPIPDGLHLDHLCLNRSCVNPEHLEPVTIAVNNRRKSIRAASCTKGHPLTGSNVKFYDSPSGWRQVCVTCKRQRDRQAAARRRAKHRVGESDHLPR